jgi:hypothetical protein
VPTSFPHEFFGFLLKLQGSLNLLARDGTRWRVDADFSTDHYGGKDVRVRGRIGADATLHVDFIEMAVGGRRP